MRHLIQLFGCAYLLSFLLFSCNREKSVEAGFLVHALDKERWENDVDFFRKKFQDMGGIVNVQIADNDAEKQLAQARELIANGIDVLVVVPVDQFTAAKIVEAAHDAGVKVISYDRLIKNCKLDYYVSTDNVAIGELQAGYLTKIKPVGNYALIGGSKSDNNSQFLYLGQMNILAPFIEKGDLKIVFNVFTEEWAENEGYDLTKKMLTQLNNKVDAIIAGNDAIASGVITALKETGLEGKVLVAGMDADLKNLTEIVKGNQTCTIYKPYEKLAATAAEIAMKFGRGENYEQTFQTISNGARLVPSFLHNAMLVNKENLKLTVISEGYQKEEEVYKK